MGTWVTQNYINLLYCPKAQALVLQQLAKLWHSPSLKSIFLTKDYYFKKSFLEAKLFNKNTL